MAAAPPPLWDVYNISRQISSRSRRVIQQENQQTEDNSSYRPPFTVTESDSESDTDSDEELDNDHDDEFDEISNYIR
ncbi:hypothetical protein EDC01DRAFT_776389 [Geopyxis carbonaria]|nr:hypothetical protein EDC01DRAFT_776389 [Geopyxis carbonaria]